MEKIRLSDCADIFSGFAFSTNDMKDNGTPILKIGNINDDGTISLETDSFYPLEVTKKLEKFWLRKSDYLVCMTGATIGKIGRSLSVGEKSYLINQRVGIIRSKNNINNDYLYYILNLSDFRRYIEVVGSGAAQANISAKDIGKFTLQCTNDIEKQNKIASILKNYEQLIENNNKRIKILEDMAESLYNEWFVRFRFPGYETIEFENGIPKDWKIKKFCEEVNLVYGKGLEVENLTENGYPVFGSNGQIGYFSEYIYEKPQILISCRGASSGVVNISKPFSFITNNSLVCEIDKRTETSFEYLHFAFLFANLTQYQTGSAQPQITIKSIENLKLIIPSNSLIEKFSNIVGVINSEILKINNINDVLTKQRDVLLPRLIGGKIEL